MAEPIKVLRVIARLNVGGPALHVAYLTEGLARRGYETTLVAGTITRGEESMSSVAESRGVHMSTLATAWVLSHPNVTGIVCGPRRPAHLWPSVSAVDVQLCADERDRLASLFP